MLLRTIKFKNSIIKVHSDKLIEWPKETYDENNVEYDLSIPFDFSITGPLLKKSPTQPMIEWTNLGLKCNTCKFLEKFSCPIRSDLNDASIEKKIFSIGFLLSDIEDQHKALVIRDHHLGLQNPNRHFLSILRLVLKASIIDKSQVIKDSRYRHQDINKDNDLIIYDMVTCEHQFRQHYNDISNGIIVKEKGHADRNIGKKHMIFVTDKNINSCGSSDRRQMKIDFLSYNSPVQAYGIKDYTKHDLNLLYNLFIESIQYYHHYKQKLFTKKIREDNIQNKSTEQDSFDIDFTCEVSEIFTFLRESIISQVNHFEIKKYKHKSIMVNAALMDLVEMSIQKELQINEYVNKQNPTT